MIEDVLLLVLAAGATAGLAQRLRVSAPLALVVVGLGASFLPGVPDYALEPEVVLYGFLPPLLFAAAWQSSVISIKQNLRAIGLLSVGLVLFTTVAVALAVHAVMPELPWAAAFALGAITAPPDAVAAIAVGRDAGLPRRLMTILAGESLVNDATALTAYRVAVASVAGGFSLMHGFGDFVIAGLGGAVLGVGLGAAAERLVILARSSVLENTLILLTPFVGYLIGEKVHASGVIVVVAAGLWLGHRAPRRLTAATRLQGTEVWRVIEFLLESIVFLLIGLQLVTVLDAVSELVIASVVVLAVVMLTRFLWVYPATYLPRLIPRVAARDAAPPWQYPTVIAWAGMRGVVSLAAAFALPEAFPERDVIVLLTFVVVIGTLLVQGLTLPRLISWLGVVGTDEQEALLHEATAQHLAATAALDRLDSLITSGEQVPEEVAQRLQSAANARRLGAWERLGGQGGAQDDSHAEPPSAVYRRLRRAMLEEERAVFISLRDRGQIDDEVMVRVQRELDLEETLLLRD
jgi:Na+/H+ antiporter